MKSTKFLCVAVIAAMVGTLAGEARAAPVTFSFGGQITTSAVAGISVGQSYSGLYTFDSAASPAFPNWPTVAQYDFAITSYTVQIGGFNVSASTGRILVANNFNNALDAYNVGSSAIATTPVPGLTPATSFFEMVDSTQAAISSFALPLTPPNVSSFGFRNFVVRFVDGNNVSFQATGSVNSLQQVPAPGALALLGAGVLALGVARRRSAQKSSTAQG